MNDRSNKTSLEETDMELIESLNDECPEGYCVCSNDYIDKLEQKIKQLECFRKEKFIKKHGMCDSYSDTIFRLFKQYYESVQDFDPNDPKKSHEREIQRYHKGIKLKKLLDEELKTLADFVKPTHDKRLERKE